MKASAFRDIWARVMFSKFSKLHEPQASASENLKNITGEHITKLTHERCIQIKSSVN